MRAHFPTLPNPQLRVVAPWWSHLNTATADGKVLVKEVRRDIAPFKRQLKLDTTYRRAVRALLSRSGPRLTDKARTELRTLLSRATRGN